MTFREMNTTSTTTSLNTHSEREREKDELVNVYLYDQFHRHHHFSLSVLLCINAFFKPHPNFVPLRILHVILSLSHFVSLIDAQLRIVRILCCVLKKIYYINTNHKKSIHSPRLAHTVFCGSLQFSVRCVPKCSMLVLLLLVLLLVFSRIFYSNTR